MDLTFSCMRSLVTMQTKIHMIQHGLSYLYDHSVIWIRFTHQSSFWETLCTMWATALSTIPHYHASQTRRHGLGLTSCWVHVKILNRKVCSNPTTLLSLTITNLWYSKAFRHIASRSANFTHMWLSNGFKNFKVCKFYMDFTWIFGTHGFYGHYT